MKQTTLLYRLFALLIVTMVLLAGCGPQAATETQPAPPPATEVPATQPVEQPTATLAPAPDESAITISANLLLDPALAQDADSLKVSQYLYAGLVSLDAGGSAQPALAASWVISDDTLDYIFTLRPDAAFSDGTPITSDTIVTNFNRWFDPQSTLRGSGDYASWKKLFLGFLGEKEADGRPVSPVDGIEKVDALTVIIHLNRPMPELLTNLADPALSILKPEALADSKYGTSSVPVIASGPYQVASWTDSGLTLSPNPAYRGTPAEGDLKFIWP
jgi:ABC-type transport system substrate-binding protein